ncbi:iron-sulfur cluster-binding protein [Desulfovibrio sp. JC010]|uniref:iron-sulfur cluster-binding protein n=1 Tax=Desulfovibrio sp. JC010 TaxID=2593641 RepID=UPI0013D0AA68|nr:iron-sulfur cluster-binding protein [Desulfovibrio sp. JC010]NDV25312.1 iron-sulfur cluster-binding protein [Desulfovibrio sp. JC010]
MTSPLFARLFKLTIFIMALTGAAQMPIFKRYYIADVPGLGWLADFYLTNKIHYIFGAVLIFMAMYLLTMFAMDGRRRFRLTSSGMQRVCIYVIVIVTGVLRVVKNLPAVTFDPLTVMIIDWTHLGFAMLLGVAAMFAFFRGRKPYLEGLPGFRR